LASDEKRIARLATVGAGMRRSPYLPVGCGGIDATPNAGMRAVTIGEHSMPQILSEGSGFF
jgi:hypothetical protein